MNRISVVLPTYNRLSTLRCVLHGLARQRVAPDDLEVVVVSDGSTDGTDDYLASGHLPLPVVFAAQANAGPATARNHGIELATSNLVLFLDDDVVPTPDLVPSHLAAHDREGPDTVVLGPMLDPPGFPMSPWVRYEQAMLAKQYAAMTEGRWKPTARQFYTGNASLERRHLVAAGGFDPTLTRAEDVELAYRLAARGLRFVFEPSAGGHHHATRRYASWRSNAYQYGRNDVVFARDRGQDWLAHAIAREFHEHHPLVRRLVRTCVNRRFRYTAAVGGFGLLAAAAAACGRERTSMAALSAVYNTTYYRGVADELATSRPDGPLAAAFAPAATTTN